MEYLVQSECQPSRPSIVTLSFEFMIGRRRAPKFF